MSANMASRASEVQRAPALDIAARAGFAVTGVLHVLIGVIALQVAWSGSGRSADQSGALQTLAGNPVGRVLLWLAVVGFAALAIWQLASVSTTSSRQEKSVWSERAKAVGKAVVYLALAWTSLSFARGGSRSSKRQSSDFTASLLAHQGGRLLVGALGLAIVAVGAYHVYKGWKRRFLQDLRENPGNIATRLGVVGYIAKGGALAIVGVLFIVAALTNSSRNATGLDGALRTLRHQPMGVVLLTVVAVGIMAYGGYSFARSRYARL